MAASVQELPIDHAELCARVRFRLDEPTTLPDDERVSRERYAQSKIARLHAVGVRVTPTLTPQLHGKLSEVCARLLIDNPPRLYIHEDASSNAGAMYAGPRCFMTMTSGLANLLDIHEIGAVIGHELGHIGMRHAHRDPNHPDAHYYLLERMRAAEVSSDRMAVVAAGDVRTSVSAMIKIASGLSAAHLNLDVDAFLKQLEERPEEADTEWEARETHPLLPFRIWAMVRFGATDLFRSLVGQEGGEPFEAVEEEICRRFRAIGEGLATRQATDHLHEALAWLGALAVLSDDVVTETEEVTLTTLVGTIWATDVIDYHRNHGRKAVESRAKESLSALILSSEPTRRRLRDSLDRFLVRAGNEDAREAVEKLLEEALR